MRKHVWDLNTALYLNKTLSHPVLPNYVQNLSFMTEWKYILNCVGNTIEGPSQSKSNVYCCHHFKVTIIYFQHNNEDQNYCTRDFAEYTDFSLAKLATQGMMFLQCCFRHTTYIVKCRFIPQILCILLRQS